MWYTENKVFPTSWDVFPQINDDSIYISVWFEVFNEIKSQSMCVRSPVHLGHKHKLERGFLPLRNRLSCQSLMKGRRVQTPGKKGDCFTYPMAHGRYEVTCPVCVCVWERERERESVCVCGGCILNIKIIFQITKTKCWVRKKISCKSFLFLVHY